MDIKLYKTKNKPNTINKKKTAVKTLTGVAIEPINLITPRVKVTFDKKVLTANYAEIALFNRFYFIKNIIAENGFFILELAVDPLESFKKDILAYNGIIERQEYDFNLLLEDSNISAYSNTLIQYKKLPIQPFKSKINPTERSFVLITTSN